MTLDEKLRNHRRRLANLAWLPTATGVLAIGSLALALFFAVGETWIAAVMAATVAAAACWVGAGLPTPGIGQGYYSRVHYAWTDYTAELRAPSGPLERKFETDISAGERLLDRLQRLTPPEWCSTEHGRLIETTSEYVSQRRGLVERRRLDEITQEEAMAALESSARHLDEAFANWHRTLGVRAYGLPSEDQRTHEAGV
jgi:hypothetical protein